MSLLARKKAEGAFTLVQNNDFCIISLTTLRAWAMLLIVLAPVQLDRAFVGLYKDHVCFLVNDCLVNGVEFLGPIIRMG